MGDNPDLFTPNLLDPGQKSTRFRHNTNSKQRSNLEQATPLEEVGIRDSSRQGNSSDVNSSAVNYQHPAHYQSGALWAYIIIAIVVAVILCYLIFDSNRDGWLDSLNVPGGFPLGFGLLVWIVFFVILVIVAYIGHQESSNDNFRMGLTWAFVFEMGLLLLWGFFFYGQHNPRVGFYILLLAWLIAILWAFILWNINRGASLLLIIYILWLTYVTWSQWLIVSHNPDC